MGFLANQTRCFFTSCQWWQALSGMGWIVASFCSVALIQSFKLGDFFVFGKIFVAFCLLRGAGMGLNQFVDRQFDRCNPRTQERPLAKGVMSPAFCLFFSLFHLLLFLVFCLLFFEKKVLLVAFIASFFVSLYSFLKRWTVLCHFWLGLCHGLLPIVIGVVFQGAVSLPFVCLGLASFCSISGTDILYSIQDALFDCAMGLKSFSSSFGAYSSFCAAFLCHLMSFFFLGYLLFVLHVFHLSWFLFAFFVGFWLKKWIFLIKKGPVVASKDALASFMSFFSWATALLLFLEVVCQTML